jgi:uncharacterized protein (DUF1778 family)
MPRPLRKTSATTLKMTPDVRDLWERCAAEENRSLTNMFEVMVREHAKRLKLTPVPSVSTAAAHKSKSNP